MRPVLEGRVTVAMQRDGSASVMRFTVVKDYGVLDFQNGNPCALYYGEDLEPFFTGYCFSKRRNSKPLIDCTAYDQLRYFKFKDTIQYKDITYTELVQSIANDQQLKVGELEDTGHKLQPRTEEGEYFEMLDYASKMTTIATGKIYTLYDNHGSLTLKSVENMTIDDKMFTPEVMEDWEYENTIDNGTYNRIKIHFVDEENNITDTQVYEDTEKIGEWGLLQFYAKTNEPRDEVDKKANALLKMLNRPVKSLKLKNVIGDRRVRAGSMIMVALPLGDMDLANWMLVNNVEHEWQGEKYVMNMEVRNEEFMPAIDASGVFKVIPKDKVSVAGGIVGGIPEDSNQAKIWNWLRSNGFSWEASAGLIGNAMQESQCDPTIRKGTDAVAMGIFQWGNNADGSRWQNLLKWAGGAGKDPWTIETQLEYALIEI